MSEIKLSMQAQHLLQHLATAFSFARKDGTRSGFVSLYQIRKGITLGAGLAPESCAAEIAGAGFAEWSQDMASKLLITPTGRIQLKLLSRHDLPKHVPHGPDLQRTIEIQEHERGPLQVNMSESPLLWLHRRKGRDGQPLISNVAFMAGERLRADMTMSGTMPRITSNWAANITSGSRADANTLNAGEAMVAARQRMNAAAKAVGPEFSGLLIDVCCFLKGLELVERERGWPPRSAKLLLVMGLKRLAEHYGMEETAKGHVRHKPSVWQSSDARPAIDARPAVFPS